MKNILYALVFFFQSMYVSSNCKFKLGIISAFQCGERSSGSIFCYICVFCWKIRASGRRVHATRTDARTATAENGKNRHFGRFFSNSQPYTAIGVWISSMHARKSQNNGRLHIQYLDGSRMMETYEKLSIVRNSYFSKSPYFRKTVLLK